MGRMWTMFPMIALSAATVSPLLSAQLVLPATNAAVEGSALLTGPLANTDLTMQWLFDEMLLGGVPAGSAFTAIGFRLDAGQIDRPFYRACFHQVEFATER